MSDRPDDDPEFMLFWQTYGRVGPRKVAWECWRKARRKAEGADIIAGLERWVAYWRTPGASAVKWPQGWLNEERWNDEPPTFLCRQQQRGNGVLQHLANRYQEARTTSLPPAVRGAIEAAARQRSDEPQGRLL
jgi:hypothetical protein